MIAVGTLVALLEALHINLAYFKSRKTGEWTTGSPQKPQVLTEDEALEVGRHIRDALVRAAQIVQSATLESIADYEKLDADLWKKVGEPYCNWGWFHKYLSMVCPDKLSSFHSSDWQKHILYALKIKPSEKYFVRSGQIAMIEKYAGWYCGEFEDVIFERFGSDIIQFVRIGTLIMKRIMLQNGIRSLLLALDGETSVLSKTLWQVMDLIKTPFLKH